MMVVEFSGRALTIQEGVDDCILRCAKIRTARQFRTFVLVLWICKAEEDRLLPQLSDLIRGTMVKEFSCPRVQSPLLEPV